MLPDGSAWTAAQREWREARSAAADPGRVGEDQVAGLAAGVLVDRHQTGHAAAILELAANQMARPLGRDHADVGARGRLDLVEVDREAVGEHQQVAVGDPVGDLGATDLGLLLVGDQDHHHIAPACSVRDVQHLQARRLGVRPAGGVRPQPHHHVHAGVLQVERVGVPLGAVAEDRDGLPLEQRDVRVCVVKDSLVFRGSGHGGGS